MSKKQCVVHVVPDTVVGTRIARAMEAKYTKEQGFDIAFGVALTHGSLCVDATADTAMSDALRCEMSGFASGFLAASMPADPDPLAGTDLACPEGLSEVGMKAWFVITSFLKEKGLMYTGGCKAFYSPKEWATRGESYGTKSELVVAYDGGSVSEALRLGEDIGFYEEMRARLKDVGLYSEECTGWYCGIYKRR